MLYNITVVLIVITTYMSPDVKLTDNAFGLGGKMRRARRYFASTDEGKGTVIAGLAGEVECGS